MLHLCSMTLATKNKVMTELAAGHGRLPPVWQARIPTQLEEEAVANEQAENMLQPV